MSLEFVLSEDRGVKPPLGQSADKAAHSKETPLERVAVKDAQRIVASALIAEVITSVQQALWRKRDPGAGYDITIVIVSAGPVSHE